MVGSGVKWWSLLLAPEEEGRPSKIGSFDETALLDTKLVLKIAPQLVALKRRAGRGPLWRFSQLEFGQTFRKVAEIAGVSVLGAHPYSLRHGGASHDSLHRHRTPEQIKKQGRWRCDSSVARYNKHARVVTEANKLSARVRAYGVKAEANLAKWILHPPRAAPPPVLPKLRGRA